MSEENKATVTSDPEEVLSYWFPEDINNADLETLQREGKRWMHGGPEVDRETPSASEMCWSKPAGTS